MRKFQFTVNFGAKPSRFYSVRQRKIQKTKAFYAVVASTFSVWSPLKEATLTWVTKVYNLLVESSSSLRIRARRTRHLKGTFLKINEKICENERYHPYTLLFDEKSVRDISENIEQKFRTLGFDEKNCGSLQTSRTYLPGSQACAKREFLL